MAIEMGRSNSNIHGLKDNDDGVYSVLHRALFSRGDETAVYKKHTKVAQALRGRNGYNYSNARQVALEEGLISG